MIFYSLLALILLSPLPFGLNHPWSWSLWALMTGLISMIWAIKIILQKDKILFFQHSGRFVDVLCLFFIVLGWAVLQSTSVFDNAFHPLWSMADTVLPSEINHAISLTPSDSISSCMRLLSYALVFCLTFYYCQSRDKARAVFSGLMGAGFLYCLYGIVIYLGDFNTILWFDRWAYFNDLSSTFVSRNHFATYAGLTLLCTVAILSDGVTVSSKYHLGGYLGLQRFMENLITRTWLPLLILFVIGTALLLSHSRGGFFSFLLAVLVLLTGLNINPQSRNIFIVWLLGGLILFGGLFFYFSSEGLLERLDRQGITAPTREQVYELTWEAILSNPWTGFGLGSFEEVFPLYKTVEIAGGTRRALIWDYAHNTYLETIFELGFPAAIALFYCFFKMAWICARGLFIRKRDWIYPATGLAATCLIAVHAVVDFSMQIPAVAYTYILLMGAACAQSFSYSKQKRRERSS